MEDRLLRAAMHLEQELFEQFNVPYTDMALKFNQAITRGGDPALYDDDEFMKQMLEVRKNQENKYTIQPDMLPIEVPYLCLDVPNNEIDELKDAMGGVQKSKNGSTVVNNFFKRVEKHNNKYKELFNINKQDWYAQYPDISYTLNKEGMRNTYNFEDLEENKFIPVFGDSNTFGMGMPVEDLWYNQLNENLPIYNSSVISGNVMDVYMLLMSMYKTKKFTKAYICIPHAERFTAVSDKGYVEGLTNGEHYFLKQFRDTGSFLNMNTRQMYRWIAVQGIINFCILHNIELNIWERNTFSCVKWSVDQNLHLPNWFFLYKHMIKDLNIVNQCDEDISEWYKHTARDFTHFGKEWHEKIAKYMLTNQPI